MVIGVFIVRHKIYPEYKTIVIKDSRITTKTHFMDLFLGVQHDVDFNPTYNVLYDGREIDWINSDADDINRAITLMKDTRTNTIHCIYVVNNIGQMAYADLFCTASIHYITEYFTDVEEACALMDIPITVLDF